MEDPLAPARGCTVGLVVAGVIWFIFWAMLALIVVVIAKSA